MTEDELTGQIAWFEDLQEMMERKQYKEVRDSIANAIKLLERQAAEGERP